MISEPAPHRADVGSGLAETPVPDAHVSQLTLLRNTTIVWSFSFVLLSIASRPGLALEAGQGDELNTAVKCSLAAFLGCALLGVIVIMVHTRAAYHAAAVTAILVYVILLTIHAVFLLATGASPLSELFIGDFVGLPAVLIQLILPTVPGVLAALVLIAGATLLNVPPPWDDALYLVVAVGHAWLVLAPFLIIVARMVDTSRHVDDAAMAAYRTAMQIARSTRLEELESRFLAHIHDNVLADLRSVAAGRMSPAELTAHDPQTPQSPQAPPLPVHYLVTRLVGVAGRDTRVEVPEHIDRSATIPAPTAVVLLDVVSEALANSRRHAPQASTSMRVSVDSGVEVVVADDGPGFSVAAIPGDRAGVRNSILRPGETVPGLRTRIESAPDRGTVVRVRWEQGADTGQRGGVSLPSYGMAGVEHLLHPAYLTAMMVVFFFLAWISDPGHLFPLLPAAVAAAAFSRGSSLRMPRSPAVVMGAAVVVMVTSQQLSGSDFPDYWPFAWTLSAATILLSLLALRDRVGMAWAALGVLVTLSSVQVALAGAAPLEPMDFLTTVVMLVPASLIPHLIRWIIQRLPELQRRAEIEYVRLEEAAAQLSFVRETNAWLGRQLANVTDGAAAALMEQRLRDAIRSPLLDVPRVTRAVWDARERGVKVRLIDDRSPAPVDTGRHESLVDELIAALGDLGDGETLTVRLLPAHRQDYATIVTSQPRRISL